MRVGPPGTAGNDPPAGLVLTDIVYDNAEAKPEAPTLAVRGETRWQALSAMELRTEVTGLAKGLIAAGVGVGDRVGLVTRNRHEWAVLSFATWALGGVLVPLDPDADAARLRDILRHCRPAAVIVEGEEQARIAAECREALPDLGRVWQLEHDGLEAIIRLGAYMEASAVHQRKNQTHPDHPAVITYQDSEPGQVRTHGELLTEAEHLATTYLDPLVVSTDGHSAALLHLPLWHPSVQGVLLACVLRRLYTAVINLGGNNHNAATQLEREWQQFRPTLVIALPTELEMIHRGAQHRAQRAGAETLHTFEAAADIAVRYGAAERPGRWLRIRRAMNEWMYGKVREGVGGRVNAALSIGPLPLWLRHFLTGVGVTTAATPPIAELGPQAAASPEEVSPPPPSTADAAPTPTSPAHQSEDNTEVSSIQQDNARLVSLLQAHPLLQHVLILDAGWPVRAALVTVDPDELEVWRLDQGKPLSVPLRELAADPDLRSRVWSIVNQANGRVSARAALRDVAVLPSTLTPENGYLDVAGHPDQAAVTRDFVAEINAMYRWHPLSG